MEWKILQLSLQYNIDKMENLERWQREIDAISRLSHHHVMQYFQHFYKSRTKGLYSSEALWDRFKSLLGQCNKSNPTSNQAERSVSTAFQGNFLYS